MRHTTHPPPASYGLAGAMCAIGIVSVVARGIQSYTEFVIHEPFNTITFILAATCAIGGPIYAGALATRTLRRQCRELRAEVEQLRAEKLHHEAIIAAIQKADAQCEVNNVLLRKILKNQEQQLIDQDTVPIARLHTITGGA